MLACPGCGGRLRLVALIEQAPVVQSSSGFCAATATVRNCNAEAGQTVFHIHLDVLAGRRFTWPPG